MRTVGTNDKLQKIAKRWDLMGTIKANPSQRGEQCKTTLASTIEAIIGAVWIDCDRNLGVVQELITTLQD